MLNLKKFIYLFTENGTHDLLSAFKKPQRVFATLG